MSSIGPLFRGAVGGLAVLAILALPVAAEDVQWRSDYASARREAGEQGKLLVLDVGTEHCFWCKRQDATTFRDPRVARLLNEQFVPVKVDAGRDKLVAQNLHVHGYPTVVIATSEGTVFDSLEGYTEAASMQQRLQHALAGIDKTEQLQRAFDTANEAIAAGDYARALAFLSKVTQEGKTGPVQQKALQLVTLIEQQAAERLERAKELFDRGQGNDSADMLHQLQRSYTGTRAAREGLEILAALADNPDVKRQLHSNEARALLSRARDEYRAQEYRDCLARCQFLLANYADVPEAAVAQHLAGELMNHPECKQQTCQGLNERPNGL